MVELKVLEAYTRDVGMNVARIGFKEMDELKIKTGEFILLRGAHGKTVSKALPLYPSDDDKGMIRIDKLTRKNLKTRIAKAVILENVDVKEAKKVTLLNLDPKIKELGIEGDYMASALEHVAIVKGQSVVIPYFGGRLEYKVKKTDPKKYVVVTSKTEFTLEYLFEEHKDKEKYDKQRESCDAFLEYMHSKKLTEGDERWIIPLATIWSNHEEK